MITLLKNMECYCPQYIGVKDILIANDKIEKILEPETFTGDCKIVNNIDCSGLLAFPGIIDGHVHIIGGGGEEGFASRINEIEIEDILLAGITTIVGLLGADDQTKSLKGLLAKAKSLEIEGITTFLYSGSYSVPIVTFTNDITSDMLLIDKVIGVGEIAISDHRSSHSDLKELLTLASQTHMGGLISNKAGLIHLHVGDGKSGLAILNQIIAESDLPIEQFLPTHVNRNKDLFQQSVKYAKTGGNIDLTSGEEAGIPVPESIKRLMESGVSMEKVTISSDANGSIPEGGIAKIQTLFNDVRDCIVEFDLSPEIIFSLVTKNAAKRLKQYPKKGTIAEGSDADILILDKNYRLQKLLSMGKLMIDHGVKTLPPGNCIKN